LRFARINTLPQTAPARIRRATVWLGTAALVLGLLTGCDSKSFLDPGELGRYEHQPLTIKITNQVDPWMEEMNPDFAAAVEPTADDLIPAASDYVVSKNDLVQLEISDLQTVGVNTIKTSRVSESGNVSLPFVGLVHIEGLTEAEAEQKIVQVYKDMQIIQRAQVSVTVVEARGRAYGVFGSVARPSQYAIYEQDFRLLEALMAAGDTVSPLLEDVYIIRRTDLNRPSTPRATDTGGAGMPTTGPANLAPPSLAPRGAIQPSSRDAAHLASARMAHSRVVQLMANAAEAAAPDATVPPDTANPNGHYVMVNGKPYYIGPATEPTGTPASPSGPTTVAPTADLQPAAPSVAPTSMTPAPMTPAAIPTSVAPMSGQSSGFAFNEPLVPQNTKIIHIPLNRLRNGELRYNIVVRPKDMIFVQPLPTGVFYVGGHVAHPGAFNLNGSRVTLKNAIVSAGMLDQLAIPQRTDIIRRIHEPTRSDQSGKEVFVRVDLAKIFAGQAADIYLKPNDEIMVGTNALAPFLAAIRGSFRITYGFGFLYDRNYAVDESRQSF
jgi:polysaccharide export outer membrane protein